MTTTQSGTATNDAAAEPRPLQVAMLITNWFPNPGGGAVHVQELSRRLATDHGCEVTILTETTSEPTVPDVDEVSVERLPCSNTPVRLGNEAAYAVGVLRELASGEYDVVHVHSHSATIPLQLYRLVGDAPVVFTVHGANLDFSITFTDSILDRLYTAVSRLVLERFGYDHVVSVSAELTDRLRAFGHDVTHIPNGVDPDAYPTPGGHDSKQLLFVGRLRPKKNPLDLLAAFDRVREAHPSAHLHLVGDGPLKPEVDTAVADRGLQASVTVHGYVSDARLRQLYADCSVFVLPSEWEGHPLVLLEAWAAGIPLLGTDVEGIREFVDDGATGRLVAPDDPAALAEAAIDLLDDPASIDRMGRAGLARVREAYAWDHTADRTATVYRRLLETATH